jgi:Uma2 family endonuclease
MPEAEDGRRYEIIDGELLMTPSPTRASIVEPRGLSASPDLVVEILSPSTSSRDRGLTLRTYARPGALPKPSQGG